MTPTNKSLTQYPIVQYNSSILGQSALPSEAAEIAAAALHMVKPNHATMAYGTLTPTNSKETTTAQQQPEDPMGQTTTGAGTKRTKQSITRTSDGSENQRKAKQIRKLNLRQLAKLQGQTAPTKRESANSDNASTNDTESEDGTETEERNSKT